MIDRSETRHLYSTTGTDFLPHARTEQLYAQSIPDLSKEDFLPMYFRCAYYFRFLLS